MSTLPPQPTSYLPATVVPTSVTITDIDIPFGSMVRFIVKWVIASIPALIILWILMAIVLGIFALVFGGALHNLLNSTRGTRF